MDIDDRNGEVHTPTGGTMNSRKRTAHAVSRSRGEITRRGRACGLLSSSRERITHLQFLADSDDSVTLAGRRNLGETGLSGHRWLVFGSHSFPGRCDGDRPCSACQSGNTECLYGAMAPAK